MSGGKPDERDPRRNERFRVPRGLSPRYAFLIYVLDAPIKIDNHKLILQDNLQEKDNPVHRASELLSGKFPEQYGCYEYLPKPLSFFSFCTLPLLISKPHIVSQRVHYYGEEDPDDHPSSADTVHDHADHHFLLLRSGFRDHDGQGN